MFYKNMIKISVIGITATSMLMGCSTDKDKSNHSSTTATNVAVGANNATNVKNNTISAVHIEKPKYPTPNKTVYLTFDDGPSIYSPKILNILQKNNIKVTFFEIGRNVANYPKTSKMLHDAGMQVEAHSWKHSDYRLLDNTQLNNDLTKTSNQIKSATGEFPKCVRPPYGSTNHRVNQVIKSHNLRSVLWDVDTVDWSRPGTKHIISEVERNVKNNSVILMHDGGGDRTQTIAALPIVIDYLKKHGYDFKQAC